MKKHAGRMHITEAFILAWLGFPGGKLHYVGRAEDKLAQILFVIEHADMPEVPEGGLIADILPRYREVKAERTWPPVIGRIRRLWRRYVYAP